MTPIIVHAAWRWMFRRMRFCVASAAAALTVAGQITTPPPMIPGGGWVEDGQPVTLSVGGAADEIHEWRKDGVVIPGATAGSYSIAAAAPSDAGFYTVTTMYFSEPAHTSLNVKPKAAPVITGQPARLELYAGQSAQFQYSATGSYPRTHRWRKDGSDIPGATESSYTIPAVVAADAGAYSVVIGNSLGTATSAAASLIVRPAVVPVPGDSYPQDARVTEFSPVTLASSLQGGSGPFTYQWLKNREPIKGATLAELRFASAALTDSGKYSVVISNVAGSATSREATLTVNAAVPVKILTPPQSQTVFQGQMVVLNVQADGTNPYSYQWLKNGVPLPGKTDGSLLFFAAAVADSGLYSVTVRNVLGEATSAAATLTVNPAVPPAITGQPVSVSVAEGEWASFAVTATASEPVTYQWYFNGVPIPLGTYAGLFFSKLTPNNGGKYRVEVKNPGGIATSAEVTLTVLPPLAPRVAELASVAVPLGRSASLEIPWWSVPSGAALQWFKNGEPIPRARTTRLTIAAMQRSDVGDYCVVATNATGSTPSFVGRVTALASPEASKWVAAVRDGDIVYFARANPGRIERYDLTADAWLAAFPLGHNPLALAVAKDALYVSLGTTLARFNLNGSNGSVFSTPFASDVTALALCNSGLIANETVSSSQSQMTLVRLADGAKASTRTSRWQRWGEIAAVPGTDRILSRTAGTSPESLYYSDIRADGMVGEPVRGTDGYFPLGTRLCVYPDGQHFADSAGLVYASSDFTFAGSLGGDFDDLAFVSTDETAVLRGGVVHVYRGFLEQGRFDTGFDGARMFVRGGDAFIFGSSVSDETIVRVKASLTKAQPLPPAAALAAPELGFTPDDLFLDRGGVLFLLSKMHRQLFRWSVAERRYLAPIPLLGWPNHVAYSATSHRVYIAYADSRVTQLRLDAGSTVEEPFFTSIRRIDTLTTADEFVMLCDSNSSSSGHWTFMLGPDGRVTTFSRWFDPSFHYMWSASSRRLYHFRDWLTPNDLLYTTVSSAGVMTSEKDSPYHGDEELEPRYPIRLSPDRRTVLLGTGRFYDADTLSLVRDHELANRIDDAVWLEDRLYTARVMAAGVQVQRWSGGRYVQDRSRMLPGSIARLFSVSGGRLLVVASKPQESPTFTFLDADLQEIFPPPPTIVFATQPESQSIALGGSVRLSTAQSGEPGLVQYAWQKDGATLAGGSGASFARDNFQPGDAGIYRATVTANERTHASALAILGLTSSRKVMGDGTEVGANIVHANGNTYDQVLVQGGAVSVSADAGQVLRLSYIDLTDDIVQVEFSGAGTLSLVIDYPSAPAPAAKYNQPGVNYVRGHANLIIAGADQSSNLSVFTVGRITAVNQSLFREGVNYDGVADLAYVAIQSRDGKFGGLRAANASFFSVRGVTGLYAPGVAFTGPVYLGDINAVDAAVPCAVLGSTPELRITGGSLAQTNGVAVQVSGLVRFVFTSGTTSQGGQLPAQANQARFEKDGVDVTDLVAPL